LSVNRYAQNYQNAQIFNELCHSFSSSQRFFYCLLMEEKQSGKK
jgi:hypothetical protein